MQVQQGGIQNPGPQGPAPPLRLPVPGMFCRHMLGTQARGRQGGLTLDWLILHLGKRALLEPLPRSTAPAPDQIHQVAGEGSRH